MKDINTWDNDFPKYVQLVSERRREARIFIRTKESGSDTIPGWLECPKCGGSVSVVAPVVIQRVEGSSACWGHLSILQHSDHADGEHNVDCYPLVCVECKEWLDIPLGLKVDI